MGALTLAELKTGVRDHFSGRTDKDTRLTQLLNIAQIRLVRDHDFEEMKGQTTLAPAFTGTVATDKFIAIPSTVKEIFSLALIDDSAGYPIHQKAGREFAKQIPYNEEWSVDRPRIFRRWGLANLEVWPIPDRAYVYPYLYASWPTDLSSESGVSDLSKKDDLLILLTATWWAVEIDRPDRANYFFAIFQNEYKNAVSEDEKKPDLDISGYRAGAGGHGEYWKMPFDMEDHSE